MGSEWPASNIQGEQEEGMKPERVNPLEGALNFASTLAEQILNPLAGRENALRDTLDGDIIIDTTYPLDTRKWETGIKRPKQEGKWVIVEQYEDAELALIEANNLLLKYINDKQISTLYNKIKNQYYNE